MQRRYYDAPVPAPTVLILAAGEGTRMKSATPKVLHPLCGRPMIEWPIAAAREAGAGRVVVVDGPKRPLDGALPDGVEIAIQQEPNGTGDAVRSAADHIGEGDTVLVLYGDVPLITADAITALARAHEESGAAATMATMELEDPSGYGRVVRASDGSVERVVETKKPGDATPEEEAIREVNTGIYAFGGGDLLGALGSLTSDNAQGELYLPDVLPLLRADGKDVGAHVVTDATLTLGVNNRVDLAHVRRLAQERIHRAHALAGVTIVDPASTLIDAGVEIGRDTIVEPGTFLRGATRIGERCEVGPLTTLIDTTAGDDTRIVHSYLQEAELGSGVSVGPFAYLRPKAHLHDGAKAGTFVEIKNSQVGEGTKVPHLSYIGDADIGAGLQRRRRHDHRQLRRRQQAPHHDRGGRQGQRSHLVRRPRQGRRRRLHRRRLGHHRRRPARRAGDRARAPAQHRGLRRARSSQRAVTVDATSAPARTLRPAVSALDSTPPPGHLARARVRQAADAVLGPREPRAGGSHREQAGGRSRRRDAQDVRRRRGLLPLPGVDPRRRRLHRPADLRQLRHRHDAERLADGAAADDRRGGRRLRPPRDRRVAVVRLLAPGQEVLPARADLRPPRGPRARVARAPTAC